MPPISGRLHSLRLLERFNDGLNDGFTSAGYHTLNVLNEPYFSFRPAPPLTSPIDDHLQPPQSCKRKALLVGIEFSDELPTERGLRPLAELNGPHKDIRDMRQFLIGGFKFSSKKYFKVYPLFYGPERWHYDPDDIILLVNDDPEAALQPTRKNIV